MSSDYVFNQLGGGSCLAGLCSQQVLFRPRPEAGGQAAVAGDAPVAWLGPAINQPVGARAPRVQPRQLSGATPPLQCMPGPSGASGASAQRLLALGGVAWAGSQGRKRARKQSRRAARAAEARGAEFAAQCADEEAMLAEGTFAIKPEDLLRRCKEVLAAGVGAREPGADFAENFEFCAPVVGTLGKKQYLGALGTFEIEGAFPDANPNYHSSASTHSSRIASGSRRAKLAPILLSSWGSQPLARLSFFLLRRAA
ncbi:unnamed protein product [Prorocentrum cordatum]|uniref:Uncharacterized protein n=1 Tax=Prorocentrum cordatum TaxID=2364126 RepID=A0ABN9U313_9DINO|nr:unnamed protein product [Polarella glacialis]